VENLKERLKDHEGFKAEPYRDVNGWSIGHGHYLGNGQSCKISRQVADLILDEDIHKATFEHISLGWELDPVRKDVVIEMIFWHGLQGFLADEMMDSNSGREYVTRMQTLADLMIEGG